MTDVLSIGIIGAGGIAQAHLRASAPCPQAHAVAVMDVNASRVEQVASEYGLRAFTQLEDLLAMPEVEAVVVCTPHAFHADQVVAAAEAGKHVLVEKPMALSVADCDRMISACLQAHRVLMVGQVMRHYPVNLKIRELITMDAIGEVGHLIRRRYSYFDPTSPTNSYGRWYIDPEMAGNCVLYCFGPHEYDILPWYLHSPVVSVYAQGTSSTELYRGQEDSITAILTHANGATSVLSQSVVCRSSAHDQYIIGSEGTLMLQGDRLLLDGKPVEIEGEARDGMARQMADFVDCCLTGRTPDASGTSVRHTMAVIGAAQRSVARKSPVSLAEFNPPIIR